MNISNEFWTDFKKIDRVVNNFCIKTYNGSGDAIYHKGFEKFFDLVKEGKFKHKTTGQTIRFIKLIAWKTAREILKENNITNSLDYLQDNGFQPRAQEDIEEEKTEINYDAVWEEPIR